MIGWGLFWMAWALMWLAYAFLIDFYRHGWKVGESARFEPSAHQPAVSVVVAARNEAANLPRLLAVLRAQDYPAESFEVLLVDDHSEDGTYALAAAAGGNVRAVQSPAGTEGKKAALTFGIGQATGDWIVATDADCVPGPGWLSGMMAYADDATFLAGPVRYHNIRSFCDRFQTLDFITLQGITAASVATGFHSMCNGANLAYPRRLFNEVGGFAGVDRLASGDDLLLMHKIAIRKGASVQYVRHPDAIVHTDPAPGWRAFWKQRVRWASKSAHYDDKRIFWALLMVYFFNLHFVVLAAWCFGNPQLLGLLIGGILLKTVVEIRFLAPVARFFGQQHLLPWFPLMQPLHILYTVLVGALSQVGKYEWKGRRLR
ncbi:MAG: glycosyltransferase [Chitinophagaceae bacterium]|nr:MAG: glycosyltransferase [Chitinophagaceae bacterium]